MREKEISFDQFIWPLEKVDEAVFYLLKAARFFFEENEELPRISIPPKNKRELQTRLQRWVEKSDFEVEPVQVRFNEVNDLLATSGPTLLIAWEKETPKRYDAGFFVLIKSGKVCELLLPDHTIQTITPEQFGQFFKRKFDNDMQKHVDALLGLMSIPAEKKKSIGEALIDTWIGTDTIEIGWYLRSSPARPMFLTLMASKTFWQAFLWFVVHNLNTLTQVVAWWLLGRVVFDGQTDTAWLTAWALMIFTGLPVQLLTGWLQRKFILSISVHFKQRSLLGMLRLDPDEIRHLGSGGLLERVYQAESIEMLAVSGGLQTFMAITQLIGAGFILAQTTFAQLSITLMLVWFGLTIAMGWVNYRQIKSWIDNYREMNNSLVEKMLGHRTRLAQENPKLRHIDEDVQVDRYLEASKKKLYSQSFLSSLKSSWMIAGIATMVPTLLGMDNSTPQNIAIGFGGIMLASQAFGLIQGGLSSAINTWIYFQQVKPIFDAVNQPVNLGDPQVQALNASVNTIPTKKSSPILSVRNLRYTYPRRSTPVLENCDADLYHGDRIVLSGSSGGGKTTFASVVAGIRKPDSGLMLMNGFDLPSIGEEHWRRNVVLSPQFYENHIFNETFGFNLLIGRGWPPSKQDLEEARAVCIELGLGELLEKMPSGFHQMMGENGWRLSHGEKSRVYIARSILQNAEILIMDESFGALDPENLLKALKCVDRRANSLMIIAHP